MAALACPGEEQLPSLEMDEGYQLIVSETAKLSAKSIHGFRRGLETLLQVFDALSDEAEVDFWTWAPGAVNGSAIDLWIEDAPKFAWRGLLLDTARHFVPLQASVTAAPGQDGILTVRSAPGHRIPALGDGSQQAQRAPLASNRRPGLGWWLLLGPSLPPLPSLP